jgi:hypothetical protein
MGGASEQSPPIASSKPTGSSVKELRRRYGPVRHPDGGSNAAYKGVDASRGKAVRAEPVAALYEQGKVKHVGGLP